MEASRLLVPALDGIYRSLAPFTEPLIRIVAGGSLAIHGFPILFGNTAEAAKFLETSDSKTRCFGPMSSEL